MGAEVAVMFGLLLLASSCAHSGPITLPKIAAIDLAVAESYDLDPRKFRTTNQRLLVELTRAANDDRAGWFRTSEELHPLSFTAEPATVMELTTYTRGAFVARFSIYCDRLILAQGRDGNKVFGFKYSKRLEDAVEHVIDDAQGRAEPALGRNCR